MDGVCTAKCAAQYRQVILIRSLFLQFVQYITMTQKGRIQNPPCSLIASITEKMSLRSSHRRVPDMLCYLLVLFFYNVFLCSFGSLLLEYMFQHCKGTIDQWVPRLLALVMQKLIQTKPEIPLSNRHNLFNVVARYECWMVHHSISSRVSYKHVAGVAVRGRIQKRSPKRSARILRLMCKRDPSQSIQCLKFRVYLLIFSACTFSAVQWLLHRGYAASRRSELNVMK